MKRYSLIFLLFIIGTCAHMRAQVSGVVLDEHGEPLVGANVYWAGTGTGVATDLEGNFTLMPVKTTNRLVASFVGCHNDTVTVLNRQPLTIVLIDEAILDEVIITERRVGVMRLRESAYDVQQIGAEEICRAACCNLSEAFETNASVDVAYADAATGAKQIRLLGLSGTYVQLLQENTPAVRGLAQNFGLEYVPGPWMSSIQVSKGTSSVINGYEATTGQINVELLKPQTQNPLSVNLMFNSEVMAEANIEGGWQIPLKEHIIPAVTCQWTRTKTALRTCRWYRMPTSPIAGSTSMVTIRCRPSFADCTIVAAEDRTCITIQPLSPIRI